MRLVDANLLIYAVNSRSPHHEPARDWLTETLSGTRTVGLAWNVLLAFIRLTTRAAAVDNPIPPSTALDVVDSWLALPVVSVVHPTRRHSAILRNLLDLTGTAGNLTTDAHLAALAIEHGAQLCSRDADFSRFPGLRWVDPLRESAR